MGWRVFMLLLLAAGTAAAQPKSVEISAKDCRALVRHRPAADVSYRPGVDVRGREVVPADLNPSPIALPETYTIDITVDLFDRLGIPPGGDAEYEGDIRVGVVEFTEDRRVLFNGRPVTDEAQHELAALPGDSGPGPVIADVPSGLDVDTHDVDTHRGIA